MEDVVGTFDGDTEGGAVREDARGGAMVTGAYSEPYAPLPGWNNRPCICAVWYSVLGKSVDILYFASASVQSVTASLVPAVPVSR